MKTRQQTSDVTYLLSLCRGFPQRLNKRDTWALQDYVGVRLFFRILECWQNIPARLCLAPNIGILSGPINGDVLPIGERMCYVAFVSDVLVLTSPPARNMGDVVEMLIMAY